MEPSGSIDASHDRIDTTPSASDANGVGDMLRKRRIELGMSQGDVANFVKLPARRIEAMEQERWEELPDGPYLRGFLKNIARALNIDATTLVDRVDHSLMRARNPDSILVAPASMRGTLPRRTGPADGNHSGRTLVLGAFVFAIIAALIAWSGTASFDRVVTAGKAWVDGQRGQSDGRATPPAAGAAPQTGSEPVRTAPMAPIAMANVQEATPVAPRKDGPVDGAPVAISQHSALRFRFNEEAWVEVRGADGKILLSRLNRAGTEQSIEGEPPFVLVVGNARGVALDYRGQAVDLAPHIRDQVARFTLS